MDPNACIQRIVNAIPGNLDEFLAACDDLAGWLNGGGFAPSRMTEITSKHLLLLGLHGRSEIVDLFMNCRALVQTAEKARVKGEW